MFDLIESNIYSRIKAQFSERIKKKYPDINFTTTTQSQTKPKFPTVYIHFMESPEIGNDIDGISVPGIRAAFQVDVSDNQSNTRTDEVAWEVLRIMKSMRFKIAQAPFHNNSGDAYVTMARYRRPIGDGDIL